MNEKKLSEAMNQIDDRYIKEALLYKGNSKKTLWLKWGILAACLALLLAAGSMLYPSPGGMTVSAHVHGADTELSSSGAVINTGTISDSGELKGHPLMFYLTGSGIASVRFSCKNQQINFMDWTEQREEYGNAQNFTVPYGTEESEYYYLTIDWVPNALIRQLTDNEGSTIQSLSKDLRSDMIVMEISFENGKKATKAITISLLDDGTFFAAFDDYKISEADSFVRRPDSEAIPRDILYAQGSEQTGSLADAAPMIYVNDHLYKQSIKQISYTEKKEEFAYLGKIENNVTSDQHAGDGVPKNNFQANHPIVGAAVYQYGDDMVIEISGKYWLYELLEEKNTEQTKWGVTLSVENATPGGLTLVCTQSGGIPTGQLQTGSFYRLLALQGESWGEVPCLIEDVAWTQEAYTIPLNDSVKWDINWESLYGELAPGTYRILKIITDFRKTADYDTEECWAEFEIK